MTSEHVGCVVDAASSTLEWIAGDSLEYGGEARIEEVLRCEGIIGCISLVGDIEWSLVLSLPKQTATGLAEGFAGFPVPFDSPDMGDAIGELSNLIAGEVKVQLDSIGIAADISLPQVFRGTAIDVLQLPHVPGRVLTFSTSAGPMWIAIAQGR